jgi:hypothetical protein
MPLVLFVTVGLVIGLLRTNDYSIIPQPPIEFDMGFGRAYFDPLLDRGAVVLAPLAQTIQIPPEVRVASQVLTRICYAACDVARPTIPLIERWIVTWMDDIPPNVTVVTLYVLVAFVVHEAFCSVARLFGMLFWLPYAVIRFVLRFVWWWGQALLRH